VKSTTRPELSGTFGMVASTHWIASSIGMKLLEAGVAPSCGGDPESVPLTGEKAENELPALCLGIADQRGETVEAVRHL